MASQQVQGHHRRNSSVADVLPVEQASAEDVGHEPPPVHPTDTDKARLPLFEMPAHVARDSMFHSQSGFENYRGVVNLAMMALFASGFRLIIGNLRKYGILVDPREWFGIVSNDPYSYTFGLVFLSHNLYILLALGIEKVACRGYLGRSLPLLLHWANILAALVLSCGAIMLYLEQPIMAFLAGFQSVVIWMKLVSYVAVNEWYRNKATPRDPDETKGLVRYPQNLTVADIYYFMGAPTLCYELNFPRNERVRRRYLARRVLEAVSLLLFVPALAQQYVFPTVSNTFTGAASPTLIYILERTLKLAVPHNLLWLSLFYMYFHSILNIVGELMRFADRQFYRDWWNATTLTYFWKNWNIPVHRWFIRHVYKPLLERGWTQTMALIVVFMISGFLHELLVVVSLRVLKLYSFLAMITQIPLAFVTQKYLKGTTYGNFVMWASLFFGQPVAIMLYMQTYVDENGGDPIALFGNTTIEPY